MKIWMDTFGLWMTLLFALRMLRVTCLFALRMLRMTSLFALGMLRMTCLFALGMSWLLNDPSSAYVSTGRSELWNVILLHGLTRRGMITILFHRFILTWVNRSSSWACFIDGMICFVSIIWRSLFQRFTLLIVDLTVSISWHVWTSFICSLVMILLIYATWRNMCINSLSLARNWRQTKILEWMVTTTLLLMRWNFFVVTFTIMNWSFLDCFARLIWRISPKEITSFWILLVITVVSIIRIHSNVRARISLRTMVSTLLLM